MLETSEFWFKGLLEDNCPNKNWEKRSSAFMMLNSSFTQDFTLSHIPLNWGNAYWGVIPLAFFPITKKFKNDFKRLKMTLVFKIILTK